MVSKLVLVWHGCLFWCMSSCLVCYLKRKRKTFVCNEYAQNKNIERIQELSLSLIDQQNKIQNPFTSSKNEKNIKNMMVVLVISIDWVCVPGESSFSIAQVLCWVMWWIKHIKVNCYVLFKIDCTLREKTVRATTTTTQHQKHLCWNNWQATNAHSLVAFRWSSKRTYSIYIYNKIYFQNNSQTVKRKTKKT